MSDEGATGAWRCRECGRENRLWETHCWYCSAPRQGGTDITTTPPAPPRPAPERDEDYPERRWLSPFHWRLPSLTGDMIIFLCGVLSLAFGIGLALLLGLLPALIRLYRVGRERRAELGVLPFLAVTRGFAVTAAASGIAFLVVVSSLITFAGVCYPTGVYAVFNLGSAPVLQAIVWLGGLLGGMVLAGSLAYGIVRAFFRRQRVE
jgi:hypothetical protein